MGRGRAPFDSPSYGRLADTEFASRTGGNKLSPRPENGYGLSMLSGSIGSDRPANAVDNAMHLIATAIEIAGVGIIVLGALIAAGLFLRRGFGASDWDKAYEGFRADLGRGILLGLEFLVAADIIGTVAVAPTFGSLGVLAAIVLIRTFLSFSLEVEIEGRWPWQRRRQKEELS
jgi:uncharacterized membrane protein